MNTLNTPQFPYFKFTVGSGQACFSKLQFSFNAFNLPQSCTGTVTSTMGFTSSAWDPLSLTFATSANFPATSSISVALNQPGTGSLRTVDVTTTAQLNEVNANIAQNNGVLSFQFQRICSSGLSGTNPNVYYGVAFPNTANAGQNPRITSSSVLQTCDSVASCLGASGCVCNLGYVGPGTSCTTCAAGCAPNFSCPGGPTCGPCFPGYLAVGSTCVPYVIKIATVRADAPTSTCKGAPQYASASNALTCDDCQSSGSGNNICGWSLGQPTYCCYSSQFQWLSDASEDNSAVSAYPYVSFPLLGTDSNPLLCLNTLSFVNVDTLAPGNSSCPQDTNFEIGFLNDNDWDSTLTWQAVSNLQSSGLLIPTATITFTASSLGAYTFTGSQLDLFTANAVLNNGRLSYYIKRWCANDTLAYVNPAWDDYSAQVTNFRVVSYTQQTCDSNAQCTNAQCACNTNYYGTGTSCARASCATTTYTGPGGLYIFNATNAGNAAVAPCPLGYTGTATRVCNPNGNGPANAVGVWAAPVVTCQPITCPTFSALNATFPTLFLGENGGSCNVGFAGVITSQCLLNTGSNIGFWSPVSGSCSLLTCPASTFQNVIWPAYSPYGVAAPISGTCVAGYVPTDNTTATQRQCNIDGTWSSNIVNPCIQNNCTAATFGSADWALTPTGNQASGTCIPGWTGSPVGTCQLSGIWSAVVAQPCTQLQCPALTTTGVSWNATFAGVVATGTCLAGYTPNPAGVPTLSCLITGNWSSTVNQACLRLNCSAIANDENAAWPFASSGEFPTGTCVPGWSGAPYRECDLTGSYGAIQNPCVQNTCTETTAGNATFPLTLSGGTASGTCIAGFSGSPTMECGLSSAWNLATVVGCSQIYCPFDDQTADPAFNATFPQTAALAIGVGTCKIGLNGRPQRQCLVTGLWGTQILQNPCSSNTCPSLVDDNNANWAVGVPNFNTTGTCVAGWSGPTSRACVFNVGWSEPSPACVQIRCPAVNVSQAMYPQSLSGATNVLGTCVPGFSGAPLRNCGLDGSWTDVASPQCSQIYCNATTTGTASYATTIAGQTATGTCQPGLGGLVQRVCSIVGQWGPPIGTCVQLNCPFNDDGQQTFASSPVNTTGITGTCNAGFTLGSAETNPTRDCLLNQTWSAVVNPCVPITCANQTAGNAVFATTNAGSTVFGTCIAGYTGNGGTNPSRTCSTTGAWSVVSNPCVLLTCPSGDTSFNAAWPSNTAAGTTSVPGICSAGYAGAPTRNCLINGQWQLSVGGSACVQVFCPNRTEGFAAWPLTPTGAVATTVTINLCIPTYTFTTNPSRTCNTDGSWGPIQNSCTKAYCPIIGNFANASWPETQAGQIGQGTCFNGFEGNPTRVCDSNGVWQGVSDPCTPTVPNCLATTYNAASWPQTAPGAIAIGTCGYGYTNAAAGPPRRSCSAIDGTWSATTNNTCVFQTSNPNDATNRLQGVSVVVATDSSIQFEWSFDPNQQTPDLVCILYSYNLLTFQAPATGATVFNVTATTITALAEYRQVGFKFFAGNSANGGADSTDCSVGFDQFPVQVVASTLIAAPRSIAIGTVTQTSIQLSWAPGSALTVGFVVSIKRNSNSGKRDFGTTYTQVQNSSSTSLTATGLSSGTIYAFLIESYPASGIVDSSVTFTYGTTAASATIQDVINQNSGLIAGIAVAIIVLFIALVIGFIYYRQTVTKKQKKLIEEYSSQLQMLTLNRGGVLPNSFLGGDGTMSPENLRANLQVPKTQFTGADATLLNTVMEVALPGFLLMDFANDIRVEARLTSGGAGTIFRATLLDAQAIQRNGSEVVAVKEVADWPTLSEDDNMERFHQEVSIMWSLSFHANIIKLIGYSETPRVIVTRLYPTDLFRYLHTQDDKSPLESHLLLHMCSGMVASVASVHSMGIAHRDLKSPNYLMQEPRAGSPFPDPILCDFGLSRTSDDSNKAFESIKGMSPRYAPPEVFARVHLRNASNTVEDDKMSDVYSLGVVLWETTARQIPWDGVSNDDIELHVRGGARVPELEVDADDKILVLLNGIIDSCLGASPERRPNVAALNSKFAAFIRELIGQA